MAIVTLLICSIGAAQNNHQNHQIFSVNKLPPKADFFAFESEYLAKMAGNRHQDLYHLPQSMGQIGAS